MTILVAGSAHLDILARATSRGDVMDRAGRVSIEVGGTACSIAINLAQCGARVRFLSAMNDSPYSKIITGYLSGYGIETHIDFRDDLPTGGFSAHIDTKGHLVSAVSSTPVELVDFREDDLARALDGATAVVLDCNLSALSLDRLVAMANDRGIPVYVSATSEEKSLRITGVSGRVKGIFMNQREYRVFCRQTLGGYRRPADAARALRAMLLVTGGERGSVVAFQDGSSRRIPAPDLGERGSRLGVDEALAAGVVLLHEIHGVDIEHAAAKAFGIVAGVGANAHCHQGRAGAFEGAIDQILHHADRDAMTGALNRSSAERELRKIIDRRRDDGKSRFSVLMLDIDHFKAVNDTFGHAKGDEVIIGVCQLAQACLRKGDFLGRWGGEEFIVVLPGATRAAALKIAERIRMAIEKKIHTPNPITVSIGCSETATSAEDIASVVERADQALYEAKRGGRNQVRYAAA